MSRAWAALLSVTTCAREISSWERATTEVACRAGVNVPRWEGRDRRKMAYGYHQQEGEITGDAIATEMPAYIYMALASEPFE